MVTEEQIKKIIANSLNLAVDELDNETPLQGGPIESLSYVELLLSLEESYQVVASDKELEQVKTIDDLIQLILNKINVSKCSGGGQAAREIESAEEPSLGSREGEELPLLEERIASVINSKTFRF